MEVFKELYNPFKSLLRCYYPEKSCIYRFENGNCGKKPIVVI